MNKTETFNENIRLYGSSQYFKNDNYSVDISFTKNRLEHSTALSKCGCFYFIFVNSGIGKISVNGKTYSISHGNGYILSPAVHYRYTLEKDEFLELYSCYANTWSYLLALNCPRYQTGLSDFSDSFSILTFNKSEVSYIGSFWKRTQALCTLPEALGESNKFYALMEFSGRYLRKKSQTKEIKEENDKSSL